MITHKLIKYVDGKGQLRAWCGAIVAEPRAHADVDCMTCLVVETRLPAANKNGIVLGKVTSVKPDGTITFTCEIELWP